MAASALDLFRAHLDHLDPEDRWDVLDFFRLGAAAGEDMVEELAPRLQKSLTTRPMRALIVEMAFYHPYADWMPYLVKALRHEADLDIFSVGCRAIGRSQGKDALPALRELHTLRHAAAFQELVAEALSECDPAEAVSYHLGRLLEGGANTRVANEAASRLARLVGPPDIPRLEELVGHPDLLVSRHALKLVATVPDPASAAFLRQHLEATHATSLGDRILKEALGAIKGQDPGLRATLALSLEAVFAGRGGDALATLAGEGEGYSVEVATAVQSLRALAVIPAEFVLLEAFQACAEGKPARLAQLAGEAGEEMHQRSRRLVYGVDTAADGLALQVAKGIISREEVLPLLMAAFKEATGREGLGQVLGSMVRAEDTELQSLLLDCPDAVLRGAAMDAAGRRSDETLLPFLLMACADPIVDLAHRNMVSLGRLAGALGTVLRLLLSSAPDEVRLGFEIAALNRMAGAVATIQERLPQESREELVVAGVEALGAIGDPACLPFLLDMLHSGQSPRLQQALAQALAQLSRPEAALALAGKARELRQGILAFWAVEGFIHAHGTHGIRLEEPGLTACRESLMACWNDKEPWPWRHRLVPRFLHLHAQPAFYQELSQLVQGAITDKRVHAYWSPEDLASAQGVMKELARRAQEG